MNGKTGLLVVRVVVVDYLIKGGSIINPNNNNIIIMNHGSGSS